MALLEIPPTANVVREVEVERFTLPDNVDLESPFFNELVRMAEDGNSVAKKALEVEPSE